MERIELTSPHDLPGTQGDYDKGGGRAALIDYANRYEATLAAVEGHWEHDLFVVEVVEEADGERVRVDRFGRIIPQSRTDAVSKEATNV